MRNLINKSYKNNPMHSSNLRHFVREESRNGLLHSLILFIKIASANKKFKTMIQKLFASGIIALLLTSCGNNTNKNASENNASPASSSEAVQFASLVESPDSYVGKTISVSGKVVHVCTMSGKKMFITGDNPDVRLFISAGESIAKFPMDLLGSEIVVEGTIEKAASGSMTEGMSAEHQMAADTCETEKALANQVALSDLMMIYSKHTVK